MTPTRFVSSDPEHPPASTLLVISRLAREGWLFEIDAVAVLPEK